MRFLVDLHCHTLEYSFDGRVAGEDIVRRLVAEGFQGVTFTDHSNVWPDDELQVLREKADLPDDFFLASGQEVRTRVGDLMCGDVLVYGPKESIPDGTQINDVIRRAKETDGFCIAAHPGVAAYGLMDRIGDYPLLAAEEWNGRYGLKIGAVSKQLCENHGLPGIGGSDTHVSEDIARGGTEFFEPVRSFDDLKRLIAAEKFRVFRPDLSTRIKRMLNFRKDS